MRYIAKQLTKFLCSGNLCDHLWTLKRKIDNVVDTNQNKKQNITSFSGVLWMERFIAQLK